MSENIDVQGTATAALRSGVEALRQQFTVQGGSAADLAVYGLTLAELDRRNAAWDEPAVREWHERMFGPPNLAPALGKLMEEVDELRKALIDNRGIEAEIADVYIVSCRVMAALGSTVRAAVAAKMAVNLTRKWDVSVNGGAGHHIEEG